MAIVNGWRRLLLVSLCGVLAHGCGVSGPGGETREASPMIHALARALTLHASFDDGPDAAFAKGDRRIYTASSYKEQEAALPGLGTFDIEVLPDGGRFGGGLKFNKKNTLATFYSGENNLNYAEGSLNGTASFWLSLNPDEELEPGYCDPIQITDSAYNDSAVWTDFTKDDKPRHFRLGVFGELSAWNPESKPPDDNPDFLNRLVVVRQPPFARGKWTQVTVTFENLGGGSGAAKLYLDGGLQGTAENISEPFTWDLARAAIRIGVNYVGLFDELAVFDRALTPEEVRALYELDGGVAALRR
jgi:hypothetical protein